MLRIAGASGATHLGPATRLLEILRFGNLAAVEEAVVEARRRANRSLAAGPEAWIPDRLYSELMARFANTNLRAVLPNGESEVWQPFSFLPQPYPPSVGSTSRRRSRPFKPSFYYIDKSSSLRIRREQVKRHSRKPSSIGTLNWTLRVSAFAVPYRASASELSRSMVSRLNRMGIPGTSSLRRHRSAARSDQRSRRAKGDRGDTEAF